MRRRIRALALMVVIGSVLGVGADPALGAEGDLVAKKVVGRLNYPSMFTIAEDGRIFYSQLFSGRIGVYDPATQSKSTYYRVPGVCQDAANRGLFGIALHPEFETNKTLFVQASRGPDCDNQVLKIVGSAPPEVMWASTSGPSHNGGRLKFGPDGYLYLSGADGDVPSTATDMADDRGKMWRFDADGTDATMIASGVRNSFGLDFDTNGNLWFSDNGNLCNEEANLIESPGLVQDGAGANFGWGPNATCEGSSPQNTNQDGSNPVLPRWFHGPAQGATGVAFCQGCGLGASVEGRLLYFLYDSKQLQALTLDEARTAVTSSTPVFTHSAEGKPLSLERSPQDGKLYYSTDTAIYVLKRRR